MTLKMKTMFVFFPFLLEYALFADAVTTFDAG